MKFNPKPSNKKQEKKQEEQKRQDHSANVRSADYQAMQDKIQAPFGKAFKTGAQVDKRKELKKGKEKHKGKGWD